MRQVQAHIRAQADDLALFLHRAVMDAHQVNIGHPAEQRLFLQERSAQVNADDPAVFGCEFGCVLAGLGKEDISGYAHGNLSS